MLETVKLHGTRCAVCSTEGNATELYPANFNSQAFSAAVFSARRLPDRTHYRVVRCNTCGLVRSDPVADSDLLAQLYAQSTFSYGDETANLKRTYGRYLAKLSDRAAEKQALLEIGCGNGFFLEEALAQGYTTVRGVEPSIEALAQAKEEVRSGIVCDLLRYGLFEPEQFGVVCAFQVLDHVDNPGDVLDECLRVMKPGGLMLAINHNVESLSARALKERSPIIDIEHTYLYSMATLSRVFTQHGFEVKQAGSVRNRYTLHYLTRLLPLPAGIKSAFLSFLAGNPIGRIPLSVPLGNLYLIAQKPTKI